MSRRSLSLAAAALALTANVAAATPRDLTVQVSTTGLQFLDQEIPGAVPSSFSNPGFTQTLFSCPFGSSTQLKVSDVKANLAISSVSTTTHSDGRIEVKVQAAASGSLHGAAAPCYLGEVGCQFDFGLSSGGATASFIPQISGNKVSLGSPTIVLSIPEGNVTVKASGCGMLSTLLNAVIPLIKGWVLGYVEDRVKETVLQNVPPELEKTLSSFTQMSGQLDGFSVSGQLQESTAKTDGMVMGIGLSVAATKSSSCPLAAAPTPSSVSGSPSFSWQGEHVGVALARTPVEKALISAWKSGLFCLTDAAMASMGLPSNLKGLAGVFFGLTSTKSLALHAHQAPKLTFSPGSDARLDLTLPGAEVHIAGQGPSGANEITARFDIKASLKVRIDGDTRALVLELVSTDVGTPTMTATGDTNGLKLDPTIFTTLVKSTVLPLLETQLNGMELVPQILRHDGGLLDPYYLYLARGATTSDYVSLYAKVFRKPSWDGTAPSTSLDKKPGALLAPQVFRFVASGSDGQTPTELLRFSWKIDSGAWSTPTYSRAMTTSLVDGKHTVEVRAIDLAGNQDSSAATVSFEVDGVRPTVQITGGPTGTITTPDATVTFAANDDRTAAAQVGVSVRVERKTTGAMDFSTLQEQPFTAGRDKVSLTGLGAGDYRITVIARDEAGNVSNPASATFSVTGTTGGDPQISDPAADSPAPTEPGWTAQDGNMEGGCSAAGAQSGAGRSGATKGPAGCPAWLLLAGLALVALAARRRR
jgi:hypothetical protein